MAGTYGHAFGRRVAVHRCGDVGARRRPYLFLQRRRAKVDVEWKLICAARRLYRWLQPALTGEGTTLLNFYIPVSGQIAQAGVPVPSGHCDLAASDPARKRQYLD
jgi:hypothetical protein